MSMVPADHGFSNRISGRYFVCPEWPGTESSVACGFSGSIIRSKKPNPGSTPGSTHFWNHLKNCLVDDAEDKQEQMDPLGDDSSPEDQLTPMEKLDKYFQSDNLIER